MQNGPLDLRLVTIAYSQPGTRCDPVLIGHTVKGTSSKSAQCDTCHEPILTCNGHFGHVKLALPAFHVGYFRMIIGILQEICKVSHIPLGIPRG